MMLTRPTEDQRDFIWPVFGDIALAMLLLFMLLLILQMFDLSKLAAFEQIKQNKEKVKALLENQFGKKVAISDMGSIRQRITFSSDVLFRTCGADTSDMREGAVSLVLGVGRALTMVSFYFQAIEVEGHTDERDPKNNERCPFASNWQLSSARATTVVQLLEQGGIEPEKLSAVGRSEFHPAEAVRDSLRTDEDHVREVYRKNRRIEMIFIYIESPVHSSKGSI